MPNATWALASERASANAGEADKVAAAAARIAKRPIIKGTTTNHDQYSESRRAHARHLRAGEADRASDVPRRRFENMGVFRRSIRPGYANRSTIDARRSGPHQDAVPRPPF